MEDRLVELAALVNCPVCRAAAWLPAAPEERLICAACRTSYTWRDGVLDLGAATEDARIALERAGVRETERDPSLGGINDHFDDLARAQGELKDAILALPYGNGSRYYEEAGYFSNVRASVAAFDFVVDALAPRPRERLLDLGADLTWSTCQMARRGLDCAAVDVNHHLPVARLYETAFGVRYHTVRAGMRDVPFHAGTFDIVLAVNALHHDGRLGDLAAHIGRMLKPGGRLGFTEPYCASEAARAAFGRAQIAAGISEQTYLLQEWHQAFVDAGLRLRTHRIGDSFAAVYERSDAPDAGLFGGFHAGVLTVTELPSVVPRDRPFVVPLIIDNRSRHVWCPVSQFPVYASYHLSRLGPNGREPVSFDNMRTPLPRDVRPGEHVTLPLQIDAPTAPGRYAAEVDLVHEYVSWFAGHGLSSRMIEFEVT